MGFCKYFDLIKEVSNFDVLLKNKLQLYSTTKANLQSINRKNLGNLSVRALNDIVKKEDFVLNSEYLVTILVAVQK